MQACISITGIYMCCRLFSPSTQQSSLTPISHHCINISSWQLHAAVMPLKSTVYR